LKSLLLSRDADVSGSYGPTLGKTFHRNEVCQEAKKASEILISEKFDCRHCGIAMTMPGGVEVLGRSAGHAKQPKLVTFALVNGKKTTTQQAFNMGIKFLCSISRSLF